MRPALVLMTILVLVGCSGTPSTTTDTTDPTGTTLPSSTTTWVELRTCPPAPYRIDFLPPDVGDPDFNPTSIEPDVWTSVGGTHTTLIGRFDGTAGIALIRGTLPSVDWPGDKGVVEIDGVDAAVGPHPDGTWVAGWAPEPQERCDLYTMVFYPPWSGRDIEAVLKSMVRVPG